MSDGLRLISWRRLRQGRLYGFAQVELPIGLVIEEVPILRGPDGGLWAALPSRVEHDGRAVRLGGDGKPLYRSIARWKSRRLTNAFSERVVSLVRAAHPHDLE
jgi:hypothetical protein